MPKRLEYTTEFKEQAVRFVFESIEPTESRKAGVWTVGCEGGREAGGSAPTSSDPCDELRPELDHVAFSCADRAQLETWEGQLNDLGIKHGGIVDAPYGSGLSFRDPDNIPLEFFAPPG